MKSTELNAADAASLIEDMTDAAEVREFVEGDERKTVQSAAEARMGALGLGAGKISASSAADGEKPKFYTINIPEIEGQVRNVTVRAYGTDKRGRNISCEVIIPRGIDMPNVPEMAVNVLRESVERRYMPVPKPDGSGNELQKRLVPAYPFSIVEGPYTEQKPERKPAR